MKRTLLQSAGMAVVLAGFVVGTLGCSRLEVKSDPPGAAVLWSADGVEPFHPWPPKSWEMTSDSQVVTESGRRALGSFTPMRSTGFFGDTVFVTVEKEGYRRPLPKAAQLYAWRSPVLEFELKELPETIAERMRAQGYLLYQGQWVDPVEMGLDEFEGVVMPKDEAFALRQRAAGLVLYDGDWMTPEEATAQEEADMQARGMVRLKGRWVSEEVHDYETSIDERAAEIRESKIYPDLTAPRILERTNLQAAEVQITNSTGQQVEFLFSGPQSRSVLLLPYQSAGFRADDRISLPPGMYDIVAIPTGKDGAGRNLEEVLGSSANVDAVALRRDPAWAEWPLAAGTRYSFNFGGSEEELRMGLEDFDTIDPELRITPPELEVPEVPQPRRQQRPQGTRPPGATGGGPGGGPGGGGGGGAR